MGNQSERLKILDGLRFLAVVAVVFYHVFPEYLPGGFIGVDIFFVISGFIIYQKYSRDLLAGTLKFKQFLIFRVRRLLPAYFVFLALISLAAFFIMPPNILINYAQVLIANGIYLQNFILFNQGDYFVDAYSRTLLHTWSLAIEEQFYLLFPLFMLLLRKMRQAELLLISGLIVISALLAIVFAGVSERMTFFLIPFRAWEFGLGFLAAFIYRTWDRDRVSGLFSNIIGWAGVIMIISSAIFFAQDALFPGPQSILALGGSCLVCVFQNKLTGPTWLALTNPVSQHLGRISYSWYLWHWPFISFYFIQKGSPPQGGAAFLVLAAGYLAAVLSYNFVEQSGNLRRILTVGKAATLSAFSFCALSGAIGAYFIWSKGAALRYSDEVRPYVLAQTIGVGERCGFFRRVVMFGSSVCRRTHGSGVAPVLLIGDSHSNMIRPVLTKMAREADRTLYVSTDICRPSQIGSQFCADDYWDHLRTDIEDLGIKVIVLAAYWPMQFETADYAEPIERLSDLGLHIFVMQSLPEGSPFDPGGLAFDRYGDIRSTRNVAAEFDLETYLDLRAKQLFALETLSQRQDVSILQTAQTICPEGTCLFAQDGVILYMDSNHLSAEGASIIRPAFEPIFKDRL